MRFKALAATLLLAAGAAPGQAPRAPQRLHNTARAGAARAVVHEPFRPPVTAEKIRTAIDDAVMSLRNMQREDGAIWRSYAGGGTALAVLAMLAAGVDPASDPQLQKALEYLGKINDDNTYVRGIRANVWEYALRKVPHDKQVRALLKADFDWLLKCLGDKEGWRYNMASRASPGDWDNSCTQYGVLGIWAAARAGLDPGEDFWKRMSEHFRKCQNPDGGWGYIRGGSSANMATAGLASMFLVFDMYHGKSPYSRRSPRTFSEGPAAAVLASIDRGMAWLGKAGGTSHSYYLYGIERTGVAGGRKYIGGRDWFAEGAAAVLQSQQSDGSINLGYGPVVGTGLCTLFLVYGGAPVAFNKLQFGDGQDWNLNPRDLANLTKHLWSAYERPLNWQSVDIRGKTADLDAPILFISGSKAAQFTEEQMLKLRQYLFQGGTILAEASDGSEAFAESMGRLVRQMFPKRDYPACELEDLPADHGVYTVIKQDWKRPPRLMGLSDGSRTFFFLSREYASGKWQADETDDDAFKLAMNLLFYATDMGSLKGKFATIVPDAPPAADRKKTVVVARVRHAADADHPRDWDAARACWQLYAPYVKHALGCDLKEADPVDLAGADLKGIHVLHLTGRRELRLSEAQRRLLKGFAEAGGTVLVDAYAGSPQFAAAARREIEATFGALQPLGPEDLLASGRFEGGSDLSRGVGFTLPARRLLRTRGEEAAGQKLLVARVGKRPAVVFSQFDLCAAMAGIANYRALGYKPSAARKVVANVLGYAVVD